VATVVNLIELMEETIKEDLEVMRLVVKEDLVPLLEHRAKMEKKEFDKAYKELQALEQGV